MTDATVAPTPVQPPPVQLSTFRRIVNFVRFWLHVRANVSVLLHNQSQIAIALQNSSAHITRLNARLEWYEREVQLIGRAGASFRAYERKLMKSAEAEENYAERERRRAAEQAGPEQPASKIELVAR